MTLNSAPPPGAYVDRHHDTWWWDGREWSASHLNMAPPPPGSYVDRNNDTWWWDGVQWTASHQDVTPDRPKPSGFPFAGATFLALSAAATFIPWLAAATLGLDVQWDGSWSTGGLIALVSSILMWNFCRTWSEWVAWIWLPLAVMTATIFSLTNYMVVGSAQAALKAQCQEMETDIDRIGADIESLRADSWAGHEGAHDPDSEIPVTRPTSPAPKSSNSGYSGKIFDRPERESWGNSAWVGNDAAYEYYVKHGGLDLEHEQDVVTDLYRQSCSTTESTP